MSEERMEFGGGKYTVINDNGRLSALRNGEPWERNLVGDNLIYWMLVDALQVSQKRDALAAELASVPKEAVERLLTEAMDQAARNGANSVSMPDDYVEIAAWLCNVKPADPAGTNTFQPRVKPWLIACFGAEIAGDRAERNHRFLEESLELVQSLGCTAGDAHQLVDYVFGRPVGEPHQEAGGVMTTLAALCLANGLDMHIAGEDELARIWTKVEQIRAKQAAKPEGSPLAEAMPARQVGAPAALGAPYATDVVEDVRDTFNRVIDHAKEQPAEAGGGK